MLSKKIELTFQKTVAKKVNTQNCSSCEYYKLTNKIPTCQFDSLDFTECRLTVEELQK